MEILKRSCLLNALKLRTPNRQPSPKNGDLVTSHTPEQRKQCSIIFLAIKHDALEIWLQQTKREKDKLFNYNFFISFTLKLSSFVQ